MQCLGKLFLSQSNCFKTLWKRSKKQLFATFLELHIHSYYHLRVSKKKTVLRHFLRIINKRYFWGFSKAIFLSCSPMSSSFRRTPCTQLTICKMSAKMQCLIQFFQELIKCISETFPKQLLLSAPRKYSNEQLRLSQSVLYLTFYQQNFWRNAMFK